MEVEPAKGNLRDRFEFTPVAGHPNRYTMRIKKSPHGPTGRKMSEADWDKFEKDIHDAFEQVP